MKKLLILITALWLLGSCIGLFLIDAKVNKEFGPASKELTLHKRIALDLRLFAALDDLLEPLDNLTAPVLFTVKSNEQIQSISNRLFTLGAIIDKSLFIDYLVYSGKDRTFRSGIYWIEPGLNIVGIADIFQNTNPNFVTFGILPGWRAEEIAALLPSSGLIIEPNVFLTAMKNPGMISLPEEMTTLLSLEGFLFPGIYFVPRSASATDLLSIFANRFWEEAGYPFVESVKAYGLSLHEAVILASIVERETVVKSEAPLISSVFLNRLLRGMPLQSDPTVQYALGFYDEQSTWWRTPLTGQDLLVSSIFNTYIHKGLPPLPICNPGIESLLSVAFPADTDYLYFRAACDDSGLHLFSKTYEEHLSKSCQ